MDIRQGMSLEVRKWAELQPDLLCLIFKKLGNIEILLTAQAVCSSWFRVSHEPQLWKCIDMRNPWHLYEPKNDLQKMARNAVHRSAGQLVEFCIGHVGSDDLLQYVADRAGACRWLCLVSCLNISADGLIETAKRLPLLEELEISHCQFTKEVLKPVGQSCPMLKCLRLNCQVRIGVQCNEEALAIAQNMPNIWQLQLFGNLMTNDGLKAILEGCPHLVSLDLRQCFNVHLEGSLKKKCIERISHLRLPDD